MLQRLLHLLARLSTIGRANTEPNIPILKDFDAARYLGQWYEIKRLDHIFERGISDAHAEYTELTDGQFLVTNTGMKNGKQQQFIAIAKPTAIKNFYKIFPQTFPFISADYRVAWVDADYQHAIVTSASFDYLWFLSRTPAIQPDTLKQMLTISQQLGFDTDKLIVGQ